MSWQLRAPPMNHVDVQLHESFDIRFQRIGLVVGKEMLTVRDVPEFFFRVLLTFIHRFCKSIFALLCRLKIEFI